MARKASRRQIRNRIRRQRKYEWPDERACTWPAEKGGHTNGPATCLSG